MEIDFWFDFGSPTAYLAHCRLQQLSQQYGPTVNYHPMLLGGVFKGAGSTSPITVPAKGEYMMRFDLPRFARRYSVELNMNPFFPINTLPIMRGVYAARELDCEWAYIRAMFSAMWVEEKNLGDTSICVEVIQAAGLDADAILKKIAEPDIKQALITSTDAALAKGVFGAPTFFLGDEMFFGQDRLDFVEERLVAESAAPSIS